MEAKVGSVKNRWVPRVYIGFMTSIYQGTSISKQKVLRLSSRRHATRPLRETRVRPGRGSQGLGAAVWPCDPYALLRPGGKGGRLFEAQGCEIATHGNPRRERPEKSLGVASVKFGLCFVFTQRETRGHCWGFPELIS